MRKRIVLPVIALAAIALAACVNDGGDIAYKVPLLNKSPPQSAAVVRVALFIDTDKDYREALNAAGGYSIEVKGETYPYFDYVILSGGLLRQGKSTAYLGTTDRLREILVNRRTLLKPLQNKGIKILIGITGGGEGVALGSMPGEIEQMAFARECYDFYRYYELDGVEFNDINGESAVRFPYPEYGKDFWSGEEFIPIPALTGDSAKDAEALGILNSCWGQGAGGMADMMSYLIEICGAESAGGHGDLTFNQKEDTPILVRETGFGRHLPEAIPRFIFAATAACISYTVNTGEGVFGDKDTGRSPLGFVESRNYAPAMIDLSSPGEAHLKTFSERLGRRNYGQANEVKGDSIYGLVYYLNLSSDTSEQRRRLSVTSLEVFGSEVQYLFD